MFSPVGISSHSRIPVGWKNQSPPIKGRMIVFVDELNCVGLWMGRQPVRCHFRTWWNLVELGQQGYWWLTDKSAVLLIYFVLGGCKDKGTSWYFYSPTCDGDPWQLPVKQSWSQPEGRPCTQIIGMSYFRLSIVR